MTDNRTTELREAARSIQGNLGRRLYRRKDVDEMQKVSDLLFEAADTIESIGNGTLTAEQVRDVIERHSMWVNGNNRCFHNGAYEDIADELNSRAERPCSMTRADRLLEELNNDRRINKQLKMANSLLRKSEAAKIERIEQLESLIRDMWREMATCTDYATPPCMTRNICEQMRNLGIEVRA